MKLKSVKKQPKQYVNQNPLEALSSVGSSVIDAFKDDLLKKGAFEARDEFLGRESKDSTRQPQNSISGDLSHGQELSLGEIRKNTEVIAHSEEFGEYKRSILKAERKETLENTEELKVKIQEVLLEIKKLAESSAELKAEFAEVIMEEAPENPGKYHLSFLEFILDSIRTLRTKVEESGAWLNAFYSKKAKRGYWNMAKKHGTSFSLNNERVVATQTG